MLELLIGSNIGSILVAAVVFLTAYLYINRYRGRKLPPGPLPLPLIGTTYSHRATPEDFAALGRKYGDVCTVYLGPERVLVLNNYDCLHEALVEQSDVFVNRGYSDKYCRTTVNPHRQGILMRDYDDVLHTSRKSFAVSMRELGVGKSIMEEKILSEADILISVMKAQSGNAKNYGYNIGLSIANIILDILLDVSYDHEDKALTDIIGAADSYVAAGRHVQLIDNMPVLRFFEPFKRSFNNFVQSSKNMTEFLWSRVTPFMAESDHRDHKCYVDIFMDRYFGTKRGQINDTEQFKFILRDLLLGGFETTNTSLKWTILYLANRQEIQEKLHEELDREIGNRSPQMSDKKNLRYMRAVMYEVQRYACVVPYFTHQSAQNTTLLGFNIPKDTYAFMNFSSIHWNESTWGDPKVFRPERFINSEGQFEKHPHVVPFAMGKRSCPGELLAKQELFLFTAKLFQTFKFVPATHGEKISETAISGLTRCPTPFEVRAILRAEEASAA